MGVSNSPAPFKNTNGSENYVLFPCKKTIFGGRDFLHALQIFEAQWPYFDKNNGCWEVRVFGTQDTKRFSFAWQTFTMCFICLKWLNLETKLGIVWPKIFLRHGMEKNPSASITLFPLLVVFSGNIPGFSKRLAFSHANYHSIPDISQKRLISSSWPPSLMKVSQGLFLSSILSFVNQVHLMWVNTTNPFKWNLAR